LSYLPSTFFQKRKALEKTLKQWVLQSIGNLHETSKGSRLADVLFEKLDSDLTGFSGLLLFQLNSGLPDFHGKWFVGI